VTGLDVKVADFGLSNTVTHGSKARSPVGTPLYSAPEVLFPYMYPALFGDAVASLASLNDSDGEGGSELDYERNGKGWNARSNSARRRASAEGYLDDKGFVIVHGASKDYSGTMADVWSMGVILFRMLTGVLPFPADSMKHLRELVFAPLPYPRDCIISSYGRDLIRRMLALDPLQRPAADDIAAHPWLATSATLDALFSPPSIVSAIEIDAFSTHPPLHAVSQPSSPKASLSSIHSTSRRFDKPPTRPASQLRSLSAHSVSSDCDAAVTGVEDSTEDTEGAAVHHRDRSAERSALGTHNVGAGRLNSDKRLRRSSLNVAQHTGIALVDPSRMQPHSKTPTAQARSLSDAGNNPMPEDVLPAPILGAVSRQPRRPNGGSLSSMPPSQSSRALSNGSSGSGFINPMPPARSQSPSPLQSTPSHTTTITFGTINTPARRLSAADRPPSTVNTTASNNTDARSETGNDSLEPDAPVEVTPFVPPSISILAPCVSSDPAAPSISVPPRSSSNNNFARSSTAGLPSPTVSLLSGGNSGSQLQLQPQQQQAPRGIMQIVSPGIGPPSAGSVNVHKLVPQQHGGMTSVGSNGSGGTGQAGLARTPSGAISPAVFQHYGGGNTHAAGLTRGSLLPALGTSLPGSLGILGKTPQDSLPSSENGSYSDYGEALRRSTPINSPGDGAVEYSVETSESNSSAFRTRGQLTKHHPGFTSAFGMSANPSAESLHAVDITTTTNFSPEGRFHVPPSTGTASGGSVEFLPSLPATGTIASLVALARNETHTIISPLDAPSKLLDPPLTSFPASFMSAGSASGGMASNGSMIITSPEGPLLIPVGAQGRRPSIVQLAPIGVHSIHETMRTDTGGIRQSRRSLVGTPASSLQLVGTPASSLLAAVVPSISLTSTPPEASPLSTTAHVEHDVNTHMLAPLHGHGQAAVLLHAPGTDPRPRRASGRRVSDASASGETDTTSLRVPSRPLEPSAPAHATPPQHSRRVVRVSTTDSGSDSPLKASPTSALLPTPPPATVVMEPRS
jgi:serine/threonine protein kinase